MVPKEVALTLEDFDALASSLAVGVGDVRGCLILSRDGLVLGAHPADAEIHTASAWVRLAALGDLERGFAQFGTETWCYVRRGPYAGFAAVGPAARPGLVIDHMDQVLLAAEEARSRHEGLRGVEAAQVAPVSKPRSHLHLDHPEPVLIDEPTPIAVQSWLSELVDEVPPQPPPDTGAGDAPGAVPWEPLVPSASDAPVEPGAWEPLDRSTNGAPDDHATVPEDPPPTEPWGVPEGPAEAEPWAVPEGEPQNDPPSDLPDEGRGEEEDVDRFSLAREFGQLLQHGEDAADG